MIDWTLAERIAGGVAEAGSSGRRGELPGDLEALAEDARERIVALTGLVPQARVPPPEAVDRATWIDANLRTMRGTLDPLLDRVGGSAGAFGAPLRAAGSVVLAAEVGGITGFLARNVLGQYELSLLDPQRAARLLLVAPNLRDAARTLDLDLEELLTWVVIHEVTHAVQFTGVPWLREHLAGLLRELLDSVELKLDPAALLRLPTTDDVRGLWDAVREGGLVNAVAGPGRKALIDRLQAVMALIEGHAEHVMDAVGAGVLPSLPAMRAALNRRRREKPPLVKLLERLLGLDLKLRQYELGKRFCDAVVQRGGMATLNRAWTGPDRLPTVAELDDPGAWMRRTSDRELPAA